MKTTFGSSLATSTNVMVASSKDPAIGVYTEKLPPLRDESFNGKHAAGGSLGKKASSQGAHGKRRQESRH